MTSPFQVSDLDALHRVLREQQTRLLSLEAKVVRLQEEGTAMRECLKASGALPSERYLAYVHRRNFACVLQRYPGAGASFETTAQAPELALALLECAGLSAARRLGAASRSLSRCVAAASNAFGRVFKPLVYALGGVTRGGEALAGVERLDPTKGAWETLPDMKEPRVACAAVALADKIYVLGGRDTSGRALSTVERFDPQYGRWEEIAAMGVGRRGVAAVTVGNGIHAIGGQCGVSTLASTERFDPIQNTWQRLFPLQCARYAARAVTVRGYTYVIGGLGSSIGRALDSVERVRPNSMGNWELMPPMRLRRAHFAAAVVSNKIYVAGGYDGNWQDLGDLERFDPETSTWETLSPLGFPRWGMSTASSSGSMYILGGKVFGSAVDSVERYDPEKGQWVSLAPMPGARCNFASVACHC